MPGDIQAPAQVLPSCNYHMAFDEKFKNLDNNLTRALEKIATKASKESVDLMELDLRHEIEEIREKFDTLSKAYASHGEVLAGIGQALIALKDNQDYMRTCMEKLTDCYTQSTKDLAIISARIDAADTHISMENENTQAYPWYIRLFTGNKMMGFALLVVIMVVCYLLLTQWHDIIFILKPGG